jgi:hypothetical protein
MTIFGIALGLVELIIGVLFTVFMLIAVSFDRQYTSERAKWWVLLVFVIGIAIWQWNNWTFKGAFEVISSFEFWQPIIGFIGIGLMYSVLEFFIYARKSAQQCKQEWEKFLGDRWDSSKLTNREVLQNSNPTDIESYRQAESIVNRFISHHQGYHSSKIIDLKLDKASKVPTPVINQKQLTDHVAAWTLLWPFYAVSMLFDDFLLKIASWFSQLLELIGMGAIRRLFNNTFKL